ncbi:MAG: hypothetical protein J7J20_01360 [Desulfurococcales archaeon]|nr:hypothetical protein [Desulfurococcales archaeon]
MNILWWCILGLLHAEGISRFLDRILIELSPSDFVKFIEGREKPVVIHARGKKGVLKSKVVHKYVVFIEGAIVFCRSEEELELPDKAQVIDVKDDLGYPGI